MSGYFALYCQLSGTKQHLWQHFDVGQVHTAGTYCIYCWTHKDDTQ
jgi:hypothetical protein